MHQLVFDFRHEYGNGQSNSRRSYLRTNSRQPRSTELLGGKGCCYINIGYKPIVTAETVLAD
jgi:hypothetical protein